MRLNVFDTSRGDQQIQVPAPLAGGAIIIPGVYTLTATRDPTVTDDSSASVAIVVGAMWFNSAAGFKRMWECVDATAGAAKWVFSGADYASGGTNPVTEVTSFGGGAALIAAEGNVNRQISAAGVVPGATAADNVIGVYSLPASSFDAAGRGINITAQGTLAANTNNKRVKIIVNPATAVLGSTVGAGGTTIADTGTVATVAASGGFQLQAQVFKYGAAAANTQLGIHTAAQAGNLPGTLLAPAAITAVESGAILIAVTGNAATTATDIALNFLEVNAMN